MVIEPSRIAQNLEILQERLTQAAQRAGRSLADFTFVAVTKNVPADHVYEAYRCGVRHLGENRVQEAETKKTQLAARFVENDSPTWNLIGNLQSNKTKKAVSLFDRIQSLDSLSLAERIHREGERGGKTVPCLIEVKVSEEATKRGVLPNDVERLLDEATALSRVHVEGLMTVAPYFDNSVEARPYFRKLRELFEKYQNRWQSSRPVLSMGMSQDFETAVEEGSNMIRIGTALFGVRPVPRAAP